MQVGGCKAGTFDRYPKHSEDEFIMPKFGRPGLVKTKMKGGVFKPSQDLKSTPTVSVVQRNVMRYVPFKKKSMRTIASH